MADPVVTITNGVPTSGTGTITTLGAVVTALGTPMQASGGSVTANAGTNLNTSTLALETGGNLAAVAAVLGTTSGAAVTTNTTGAVQQYLRGIVSLLVSGITVASHAVTNAGTFAVQATLQAGANLIGKVGIDQTTVGTTDSVSVKSQGFSSVGTWTGPTNARTADTNVYAINDVIGSATGTTAALTFSNMGLSGKEIVITSGSLEIDASAVISGETSYRLYLYNVTPLSALADNAAFDLPSGDRASYLGYVDLGAPADLGSTLYVESNLINKQITLSGTNLFGYLVTNGGYTPTSARVYIPKLHSVAV